MKYPLSIVAALVLLGSATSVVGPTQPQSHPPTLPLSAQAKISAAIGRDNKDFFAKPVRPGFEATTARQRMTSLFTRQGVGIRSGGVQWTMSLRGYGHGNVIKTVSPVAPRANSNRIEYRHGALTEWYVNGPAGLEQGFTIQAPREVTSQPLAVALEISGNTKPNLNASHSALSFDADNGRSVLRYAGLSAYDATGKQLPAWLELQGAKLLLKVEDRAAVYPVVIDPVVEVAALTASDGASIASAGGGSLVAINGNTIVAGDPGTTEDIGKVYVFTKPANGWANMTQTAILTASDGAAGNAFGFSVAISGNTIVVGASGANVGGNSGQGAAYVYVEPAGGWTDMTETAELTASNGAANNAFGTSVAVTTNGSKVAIGSGTDGGQGPGVIYLYLRPRNGWATTSHFAAQLTTSDGTSFDGFPGSVAISGNTVVGSAVFSNSNQGAAYVFVRPATGWGNMTQTAKLTASDATNGNRLGTAVAVNGNTILVGADRLGARPIEGGALYLFVKPGGGWTSMTETAQLTAFQDHYSSGFGNAVGLSVGEVVAGAYNDNLFYVFQEPASGWATTSTPNYRVKSPSWPSSTDFGLVTAIYGGTIVVGGPGSALVYGP